MNRTVVAANFVLFLLLAASVYAVPTGRFALVIAPAGADEATTYSLIARAGGTFVRPTRYPFMAVAYSEREGFARSLMREGAVLVLNHMLAAGCRQED